MQEGAALVMLSKPRPAQSVLDSVLYHDRNMSWIDENGANTY